MSPPDEPLKTGRAGYCVRYRQLFGQEGYSCFKQARLGPRDFAMVLAGVRTTDLRASGLGCRRDLRIARTRRCSARASALFLFRDLSSVAPDSDPTCHRR